MKQKTPRPIQEIVAEISKSTQKKHSLQYVFVEGVDDVVIYSEIARKKGLTTKLAFEQQGGRKQLFGLYDAIKTNVNLLNKTIFLADQDVFVFNSIPSDHDGIHFTKGYSIENDLFEDGFEFLMTELSDEEKIRFERLVSNVSEWYAYEMEKVFSGNSTNSKIAISGLHSDFLNQGSDTLSPSFLAKRGYQKAEETLCLQIKDNYKRLLRGKILFELLLRISFDRGGVIHHKNKETFWNNAITVGLQNSKSHCDRIVNIFKSRTTPA